MLLAEVLAIRVIAGDVYIIFSTRLESPGSLISSNVLPWDLGKTRRANIIPAHNIFYTGKNWWNIGRSGLIWSSSLFLKRKWSDWLFPIHISPLSRRTSPSWHIPSKLHAFQRCHSVDKSTRGSQSGWTEVINQIYWFLKDVFVHCMKCLHGNKHRPEQYYPVPTDPTSIWFS